MMDIRIEVELTYSRSPNFRKALRILRNCSDYSTREDERGIIHQASFGLDEVEGFTEFFTIASGWKGTKLSMMGKPVLPWQVLKVVTCYLECCASSAEKEGYCFGRETPSDPDRALFGCRFVEVNEFGSNAWWKFGTLNENDIFLMDKKAIKHRIDRYLNETLAIACPAWDPGRVERVLANLPDIINPKKESGWAIVKGLREGRRKPIGIQPTFGSSLQIEEEPLDEEKSDWIDDINPSDFEDED